MGETVFGFEETSIQKIHKAFGEKMLTVRELVMFYLLRIAEFDQCPDGLNSILEINPDALFIADMLDEKLANNEPITPLFGIPILLKDNINTADKLHTSAGSLALADNIAPYDAHIVKRLREAGAIILGKANMTEFANYMTQNGMPAGYSSRGGQVLYPFSKNESPGGSSSGSAVSVAAGFCTASIGTDSTASLIQPAARNGLVAIRPTTGLVGRSGIIPISNTHDAIGPITRTVRDAAVLLGVMAGYDPGDASTYRQKLNTRFDYTKHLEDTDLRGIRIGINRSQKLEMFRLKEYEKLVFDRLCQRLTDAGAILIDHVDIDSNFSIGIIMRHEFKNGINYYLNSVRGCTHMTDLKSIIDYNEVHAETTLKYGQSTLIEAETDTSGKMTEPAYWRAMQERENAISQLNALFDDNDIDVMLCETLTNIAAFTGFPWMTIPIGKGDSNIPIGSNWIARRFDEGKLIGITYAVEQLLS